MCCTPTHTYSVFTRHLSASCAFPLLYEPVRLQSKSADGHIIPAQDSDVRMCDGSLSADLPHDRLKELFNVQVFIVSQVNPHVVKFLENPAIDSNGDRPGPPSFFRRLIVRCSCCFLILSAI